MGFIMGRVGAYLLLGSWYFLSAARFLGSLNSSICSGVGPGAACVDCCSKSRKAGISAGAAAAASAEYHLHVLQGVACLGICDIRTCRKGRVTSRQVAMLLAYVVARLGWRSCRKVERVSSASIQTFWTSGASRGLQYAPVCRHDARPHPQIAPGNPPWVQNPISGGCSDL